MKNKFGEHYCSNCKELIQTGFVHRIYVREVKFNLCTKCHTDLFNKWMNNEFEMEEAENRKNLL